MFYQSSWEGSYFFCIWCASPNTKKKCVYKPERLGCAHSLTYLNTVSIKFKNKSSFGLDFINFSQSLRSL